MEIINKKYSNSKRFKPGYNIALGKDIRSSKEYVSEMKKGGFEPFDPTSENKVKKDYTPSKECHEKIEYIRKHTDKSGKVHLSGKMQAELRQYLPKR